MKRIDQEKYNFFKIGFERENKIVKQKVVH